MDFAENGSVGAKSPEKTSVDTRNNVGFRRPNNTSYQTHSSLSSSDPNKTGEGETFKHQVGEIEVEIVDDVGTRGFHLSEIDPTTVCMSGFHVKPDLRRMTEILQEAGELYRLKCVPTKSGNTYINHYIFAHFESNAYTDETPEVCRALVAPLKQPDENILCINRHSNVDQVFFGSLMENITEMNLVNNVDFGNLIHLEIKRRPTLANKGTNYGFATLLDSQASVEKLVEQRYHTVKGCRIEFKPKLNKKKAPKSTKREEFGSEDKKFSAKDDDFTFRSPPPAPMYDEYRGSFMRNMRKQAYQQQREAAFFKKWLHKNPMEKKMWRNFVMRKMMRDNRSPETPQMLQRGFDKFSF